MIGALALFITILGCDDGGDNGNGGEDNPEAFATATWDGEELEFDRTRCFAGGAGTLHTLEATGEDHALVLLYELDPHDGDPEDDVDLSDPSLRVMVHGGATDGSDARYDYLDGGLDAEPGYGRFDDDQFVEISGTAEATLESSYEADLESATLEFHVGC